MGVVTLQPFTAVQLLYDSGRTATVYDIVAASILRGFLNGSDRTAAIYGSAFALPQCGCFTAVVTLSPFTAVRPPLI